MPQSRWRYAWGRTELLRLRRDFVLGLIGGLLAVVAVSIWGSEAGAGDQLIAAIATFVGVFIVVPLMELLWNFLNAPIQMLHDDVRSIRHLLERQATRSTGSDAVEAAAELAQPPLTAPHLQMLRAITHSRDLEANINDALAPDFYRDQVADWVDEVEQILIEAGRADLAEDFLTAASGPGMALGLLVHLNALVQLAEGYVEELKPA